MTSAVPNDSGPRPRDAAASRRALLDAAGALFHARGYDGTTVREIGERAGIDPALIARYFGGKEGLYLAVLAEEDPHADEQLDPRTFVAEVLHHWDDRHRRWCVEPGPLDVRVARSAGDPGTVLTIDVAPA